MGIYGTFTDPNETLHQIALCLTNSESMLIEPESRLSFTQVTDGLTFMDRELSRERDEQIVNQIIKEELQEIARAYSASGRADDGALNRVTIRT
jgi:hypothetical protein